MDIRELSYGNYIQNPLGAISTFQDLREINPDEVLPVELNKDILEAIGFQKNGVFWDYDNREETDDVIGFRLGQISNGFVLLTNFRTISVNYLHQLQNLMIQAGIKEPLELPLDDTFHFKRQNSENRQPTNKESP